MTKKITPKQYVEKAIRSKLSIQTLSGVTKAMREDRLYDLPGVISKEQFGRFYLLEVELNKNGTIKVSK